MLDLNSIKSPMPVQNIWSSWTLHVVCFVFSLFHRCSSNQGHMTLVPGQKVVSGATQLTSFSRPGMSSILCAASCHSDIACDLYHFSHVNNVCVTFSQSSSFDTFLDLVADLDWSSGMSQQLSHVSYGAWTLVFRAQSKIGVSVWDTWINSSKQDDNPVLGDFPHACLRMRDYSQCDRHFRSHILDEWTSSSIMKVRYSLVKDDVEVGYVKFDGNGSDMLSWFSEDRILESQWSPTLEDDTNLQAVSIQGSCNVNSCRRFLIHETFDLCRREYFYTFVIDMAYDTCNTGTKNWEIFSLTGFPVFVYAPGTGRGSFGIDRGTYVYGQEADVLAVWVKFG